MTTDFQIASVDDPDPWDRQAGEPPEDFLAFTVYRNMGPSRTYAAVARETTRSSGHISDLARQHDWNARAADFDFYQDRIFQAELAERQRAMARQHVELATQALTALRAPVDALLNKFERDPEGTMIEFGAKDLAKLMKMAQDSIRLMPGIMGAQKEALKAPDDSRQRIETEHIDYGDAHRIGSVLNILREVGVLDAFLAKGSTGEIVDAEIVEMDDDQSDDEADRLPVSTP